MYSDGIKEMNNQLEMWKFSCVWYDKYTERKFT